MTLYKSLTTIVTSFLCSKCYRRYPVLELFLKQNYVLYCIVKHLESSFDNLLFAVLYGIGRALQLINCSDLQYSSFIWLDLSILKVIHSGKIMLNSK